jgi:hypothetical protein
VTSCSGGMRSIQLSYGRLMGKRNKPSSVSACAEASHFSGTTVTRRLEQPTRDFPNLSAGSARAAPSPLLGLAPGGVYHAAPVTGSAVVSYTTLSPLPVLCGFPRGHRRFAFCGTFQRLAASGRYPAPCPVELGLSSAASWAAAARTRFPTVNQRLLGTSAPRRSRTPNLRIRSPTLYPIELWAL